MNFNTTTFYIPTYNLSHPEMSIWNDDLSATSQGWATWTWQQCDIPHLGVYEDSPSVAYLYNVSNATSYGNKTGDICRYIGDTEAGPKEYRMPKASEFLSYTMVYSGSNDPSSAYNLNYVDEFDTPEFYPYWSGNAAGTSAISNHLYIQEYPSVKFPASAWRRVWGFDGVNWTLHYWSGSPYYSSGTGAYAMRGIGTSRAQSIGAYEQFLRAGTIRCIKHT
jgi:hypothetical protein